MARSASFLSRTGTVAPAAVLSTMTDWARTAGPEAISVIKLFGFSYAVVADDPVEKEICHERAALGHRDPDDLVELARRGAVKLAAAAGGGELVVEWPPTLNFA